ncbi:MAG: GspE/PulE family protein [Patescibacteria group bacterium]
MPDKVFEELRKKEEEDLAVILSQKYGIPYIDIGKTTIEIDSLKIIPESEARARKIAVIQSVGKKLQAAVTNPENPSTKEAASKLKDENYEVSLFLVSESGFQRILEKYKEVPEFEEIKPGIVEIEKSRFEKTTNAKMIRNFLEEKSKQKEAKNATEILGIILEGAIIIEASDIHMEPRENSAIIRLRLDGVLHETAEISADLYKLLLSRIKLVSELKLNVHDRPQDGRFTIRLKNNGDIEARTSTLPGPYGESVAIRILLPSSIEILIKDLGMQSQVLSMMEKELMKPNGMIITTGPTGSGKTTTLYTFLKKIASPEIKVITIEDPIEYHIKNITQTQIEPDKGYDFGNGLKSILRQDPDVILVGEIRDLETANIAMHASLTGHLVFSTLHTNNAAGTIPRLIDLGIKPNIIAPAINVAIAQRLVRKLCAECKKEYSPEKDEEKTIIKNLGNLLKKAPKEMKLWKTVGCEHCNFTGYRGRTGIFEAFLVNDEIERLILQNPPEADIKKAAEKQGMITIYQDGLLKVLSGITSFEELNRVVSEE